MELPIPIPSQRPRWIGKRGICAANYQSRGWCVEQRVRKLETDVAVLGQRVDTVESEVSAIRQDIQGIKKEIHQARGLIIASIVLVQAIASLVSL